MTWPSIQELEVQVEDPGDAFGVGPAVSERLLRGDDIDVGRVEVIDLEPDGVLEAGPR